MIFSCSIFAIFSYNVERFYTLLRLLQLFLRVFYSNQAFFSSRLLDLVLWYTFRLKDNFSSLFYEVFLSRRDHANNNWFQRLAFRLLGTKLYRQITLSVVKARWAFIASRRSTCSCSLPFFLFSVPFISLSCSYRSTCFCQYNTRCS